MKRRESECKQVAAVKVEKEENGEVGVKRGRKRENEKEEIKGYK